MGYIAEKSGHARGSTIDLTIIPIGKCVINPLILVRRILNNHSTTVYLDDGIVDMGSSFDLFDEASHTNSTLVNENQRQARLILKNIMEKANFINYERE